MEKNYLLINTSWHPKNTSIYGQLDKFYIDFYRLVDNQHEVSITTDCDKLETFLKGHEIPYTKVLFGDDNLIHWWVKFKLECDVYVKLNSHIELRAK